MNTPIKKIVEISSQILYKGFASILEYVFRLPENNELVRRTVITRPSASAILLINQTKGTVILIRQFRAPVYYNNQDGQVIEIPAGVVEKGEDPLQTILRETLEETGYKVSNPELMITFYPTVGLLNEVIHIYYGYVEDSDRKESGGGLISENEFLEVVELSFNEAFTLLERGEIIDGKTIIAIQWLKNKMSDSILQ